MCAKLEVSRSGFYAWLRRPESRHAHRDRMLANRIYWRRSGGAVTCRLGIGNTAREREVTGPNQVWRGDMLTGEALSIAVSRRRPPPGLVFHSDRGGEYGGYTYRDRLVGHGIVQSMNRPKTMTDNAHVESFFHTLKTEAIHGRSFSSFTELDSVVHDYIRRYNRSRVHSALGYLSPVDYERANARN